MERKLLAATVALMGIAIVASQWPPRVIGRMDPAIAEYWMPPHVEVPPGHRGIVRGPDGTPAANIDVFLTEQFGWGRIYSAVRTNDEGHFPLLVPPGRYRVQGLFIDHEIFIPENGDHPDVEVRIVPQPLLKFLATIPLAGVKTAATDAARRSGLRVGSLRTSAER